MSTILQKLNDLITIFDYSSQSNIRSAMSTKTRLHCLVTPYMAKEYANYLNGLNMVIIQFLGNIFIELTMKALTVMTKETDTELLTDFYWAFSYLSDIISNNEQQQIKAIINNESMNILIQLLDHKIFHVRHKALKTIYIIAGSPQYTKQLIKTQIFQKMELLQHLPQYVQGCYIDDPQSQFESTQKIRKLLSIERQPPIQLVIDSGIVHQLIQFLKKEENDRLQFEAVWCLTNIVSGTTENTAIVVKYGALPILSKLLQSKSDDVKEQTIWALGNIAGDSPKYRNLVLSHDVLSDLLPLCDINHSTQQQVTLSRNVAWTLSNFCRGNPSPDWKYTILLIKALNIMIQSDDVEILQDVCWAFSYLSDIKSEDEEYRIKEIVESGLLDRFIQLLDHSSPHVRHPALRTIGNIVTGNDELTQKVINLGVLKKLPELMQNDRVPIRREACWAVSNITAGSKDQIEAVIAANLFQPLIRSLKTEKYEIAKEALWAVSNATSGSTDKQISFLVQQGIIPPLCQWLRRTLPPKIMLVALEGMENILGAGNRLSNDGHNKFADYVEESGGIEYLEQLQSNQSVPDEVYEKAALIVREYFDGEEFGLNTSSFNNNDNDNSFPSANINGNMFGFGIGNDQFNNIKYDF